MLVVIGLLLEVLSVLFGHRLPLFANFLHHFERAHVRVIRHNLGSRLLHEDHVGRQALLRLLDCLALVLELF